MSFREIEAALFRAFIERNNILARIEEIEKWRRDQAAPSIKTNVSNIQNINTNITDNLLPQILQSASIAQDASNTALSASDQSISASNIAVEAKETAEGFLKRIEDAETNAVNASENALNAFDSVQDFADRLTQTGKQLETDLDALLTAESKFRTVLTTELDAIRRQLIELSDAMKAEGVKVEKEGKDVQKEMQEIIDSMRRPISDIQEYARRLQEDDAIFIPFNAAMAVSLIVSSYLVNFTQTFAGAAENPGLNEYYKRAGNGTIVEELIEGLREMGVEFIQLGIALGNFSTVLQAESTKVSDRINLSSGLINNAFKEFIDTFHKIFFNLSFNMRGETPPP